MFSLICASINGWVNNREAGDLRRHHAHYDVNVMTMCFMSLALSIRIMFILPLVRDHWNSKTTLSSHYSDVIMSAMPSQITGVSIVCSTVCSGTDQRKVQSSASMVSMNGIHRWPVDSPQKGQQTRKMFPFDHVIMWFKINVSLQAAWCMPSSRLLLLINCSPKGVDNGESFKTCSGVHL